MLKKKFTYWRIRQVKDSSRKVHGKVSWSKEKVIYVCIQI